MVGASNVHAREVHIWKNFNGEKSVKLQYMNIFMHEAVPILNDLNK